MIRLRIRMGEPGSLCRRLFGVSRRPERRRCVLHDRRISKAVPRDCRWGYPAPLLPVPKLLANPRIFWWCRVPPKVVPPSCIPVENVRQILFDTTTKLTTILLHARPHSVPHTKTGGRVAYRKIATIEGGSAFVSPPKIVANVELDFID